MAWGERLCLWQAWLLPVLGWLWTWMLVTKVTFGFLVITVGLVWMETIGIGANVPRVLPGRTAG